MAQGNATPHGPGEGAESVQPAVGPAMTSPDALAVEQRRRELEVFAESSRLVAGTLDLGEVLDRLAGIARIRLAVDIVRIWLIDERSGTVALRAQTGARVADSVTFEQHFTTGEGLAGWVVTNAEPLALTDALDDPRVKNRQWFEAEGIRSFVAVPIMLDMSPIGLVACMSRERREFSAADMAIAAAVAAPAAVAVRNAGLYAEALGRLEEIQAFQRVTSETLSSPDLETVLHTLVRETKELLHADAAFCSLLDTETNELETVVALNVRAERFVRFRVRPGEGLVGMIVAERRPFRSDDYLTDTRFTRGALLERWARAEGLRAMLAAPVLDQEGRIVAILWGFNRTLSPFTATHEERLVRLAQQAALAIGKARSFEDERRRAAENAALLQIARACTSTLDLKPLLREIACQTAQALSAERCTINLWIDERLVPVMSQFADGHSDPALWEKYQKMDQPGMEDGRADVEATLSKQPVAIDDTSASTLVPPSWIDSFGIRALIVVPLISKDRVIGTLMLDHTRGPRRWARAQIDLAMTIAAQVALAVETSRQYHEAQQRAVEVETLAAIGETLTSTLDLQGVLEAIAESAKSLIGAQRAAVFELEPGSGFLRARASRGIDIETGWTIELGQGAAGSAALGRQPVASADVLADAPPNYDKPRNETGAPLAELARRQGYRAVLAVPVLSRETVLGSVCVFWDEVHAPNEREIHLLTALGRQAAIGIENARLVSDLRRTLDDLRAAQETLVRGATLRAVGELAAGAAHHLNNLMAVVLGRAQLLLMRDSSGPMAQSLKTIERAAVDAADTVRRIQAFGKTDRDAQSVTAFDLDAMVQEALQLTRSRWENEAQARGVRIQVGFEPSALPKVPGRASEIREVVANLILNAVDALPSGGSITIRSGVQGNRAVVSVKDTGVGMSDEVKRRVFEPFFTTKGVKSTGLGLPVAYGTIRRHGGEITVESAPERGTTVSFWLPLGTEGETRAVAAPRPPDERRGTILVIDDEEAVRDLVADVLSGKGHAVAVAAGGREGVARFAAGAYDVVLTDLGMPDMTGWEVARQIKATHPTTPVLLITGWGDVMTAPPETVVDGVITKPFDVTRLTSAVDQALRDRARSAAT